jgi:hypothetical protein
MPPEWSPDLATNTMQQIAMAQNENNLWHKALHTRMAALVKGRLSMRIGREEYTASRLSANLELAEWRRRRQMLLTEIDARVRCSKRDGYPRSELLRALVLAGYQSTP